MHFQPHRGILPSVPFTPEERKSAWRQADFTRSGVTYTNIRMGVYADAFPCFLNWYPSTEKLYLPSDGKTAYASRQELGEATANLMVKGGQENKTVS